jgi:hypothetical protein
MLQHIVMMKFAEGAGPAERPECLRRMQEELPEHIDFLGQYQAGADELQGSRSWDVSLVSAFDSVEQLLAFRDHPAHQAAQEFTSRYQRDGQRRLHHRRAGKLRLHGRLSKPASSTRLP